MTHSDFRNANARLASGESVERNIGDSNNTAIPKKWQRVLSALLDGRTFNLFEAERQLNDHALHSTVSSLQAKGVTILREFETVPGYQGIPTHVCRYWLEQSEPNLRRASVLLNRHDSDKEAA
ncbi:hypothetical protein [Methylophilus sp. OH31]|uniref:hypothetical protein n=1 Tax=Methylophilus sp. OH31 TaxID=1387312 RepID=UPI00046381A1|nr:hypothetical protein [Methylophilus sp. OH31]